MIAIRIAALLLLLFSGLTYQRQWRRQDKAMAIRDNKPLATLIPLYEDEWVVVTPDGLFDASPGGEDYLHFVVNTSEQGYETIELDQFKSRYYERGLLQKLLSGEPVRKS